MTDHTASCSESQKDQDKPASVGIGLKVITTSHDSRTTLYDYLYDYRRQIA